MNHIELHVAGVEDMTPLELALPAAPASCAFLEAVEVFARVCATTRDARARAAAWGPTRGFDQRSQVPGEVRSGLSDLSVDTLAVSQ